MLARPRNGRGYLATIRSGKGVEIHLGLYETAGLAALAFNVAWLALGRGSRPPNEITRDQQPSADEVRALSLKVRRRLGLESPGRPKFAAPPTADELITFFEVTVVGFWTAQAFQSDPTFGLDAAARRVVEAARLIFGRPDVAMSPTDVITRLLGRRVEQAFRRADILRAILDDDGDDDWRLARWLIYPEVFPSARGWRDEVRYLYPEHFEDEAEATGVPHWAIILGVDPPFQTERIREAYRARSKAAHPDAGGTHSAFVRLRSAYEEAIAYCRIHGV